MLGAISPAPTAQLVNVSETILKEILGAEAVQMDQLTAW